MSDPLSVADRPRRLVRSGAGRSRSGLIVASPSLCGRAAVVHRPRAAWGVFSVPLGSLFWLVAAVVRFASWVLGVVGRPLPFVRPAGWPLLWLAGGVRVWGCGWLDRYRCLTVGVVDLSVVFW